MKHKFNAEYWNNRYKNNAYGWDIGFAAPAITNYFNKIKDKSVKILIPGCGSAYEGEYLLKLGFENLTLLDAAEESKARFLDRMPNFDQFFIDDFFNFSGKYDYIIEQTFFCALDPSLRNKYAIKMKELLSEKGKLVGLMFNAPLNINHPPFGGNIREYKELFKKHQYSKVKIEETKESIPQRMGKEVFIEVSS